VQSELLDERFPQLVVIINDQNGPLVRHCR
jgi:hypothetical protein